MNTILNRTVLNVTTYCNLKCKHCLAFIPYYEDRYIMPLEDAVKILDNYFKVVDEVKHFTVTGGEPLLNVNTFSILQEVFKYETQITESVDIVTNGTMEIPREIIELLKAHPNKARVILSDYGPDLSIKLNDIKHVLDEEGIRNRISKFYGDDLYYSGWIDFRNHSLKWNTVEDRDRNSAKCIHSAGKYYVINDGELHRCSRSYWRMRQGIIPKVLGEYVPLIDETYSIEEKRALLKKMYEMTSSTSCAHCVGLCNDVPRVKPAQQLE